MNKLNHKKNTPTVSYEIEESVYVLQTCTEEEDPESFYYFKQFEKKEGVILEVIEHPRLQYRVKFGQAEAVLYHEELTNGNQQDVPITGTDNQEGWEGGKVEWYTQKEVADLLGVSKATVYHYGKQKKIIKILDPHRLHKEARYEKAEVDRLVYEKQSFPTGMSPNEVAKKLGLSVQSVYKYIQDGSIKAEAVPYGDERITYVISETAYQEAEKSLKPTETQRPKKYEYYDSKNDMALFQRFHSSKIPEARVVRNEENVFGFYLPNIQKLLTYEEGINNYALKPSYSIHQTTLDYKGYVELHVPKNEVVFYPFLDYLYEIWGVENIRLREQSETVLLYIKAGEKPLKTEVFGIADLLPYLISGEIHHEDDILILRSSNRKTSLELPIELLETISDLAEQEGISISKWVEQKLSSIIK
ncbi:helix-turn-helix domain-containing protein [Peribacillus castrilensis]|uniref:DNA binding domain, excisionase family n=1 Tax=Peribacillus simplex TaxID=1478 RepID=A0AAN2PIG2_9BACI|nr:MULTISPECIES: helix-turn-helix domain-containing protein [Bacillaceae]MCF7621988.1 helix-turn-helix domain-containing protein [Peribacillus frigoritolerans]MCP1156127.1 helix-turn-helix domain-containing protein [Peribacillus frigoritolerans]MCT1390715.1 helix-turn-helix domain-containing protein [Peribacillus frigoritolerans]CEG33249.1 DNA binding domain, excisionase family [Peribacillus simplex]